MNRLWKSTTETVIVRFLIASLNLAFQKHKFTEILHKNNNFLSFLKYRLFLKNHKCDHSWIK